VDEARSATGPWYSERRWERFAPLAGILAVLLWILGVTIVETAADAPGDESPAAEWVQFFEDGANALVAGAFIFMIGSAVFLWFLGSLRARVATAEAGSARVASILFAAGIVIAVMGMGFVAPYAAGGFAAGELNVPLEPGAAQALAVLDDGFFIGGEVATAIFFLATGIALLRTRVLPVWLAWASLVLGVAALLPWIGWAVFLWALPLWVLVTSVLLFARPARDAAREPTEARPVT